MAFTIIILFSLGLKQNAYISSRSLVFHLSASIKLDIRCTFIIVIALARLGVHSTRQIWLFIRSFVLCSSASQSFGSFSFLFALFLCVCVSVRLHMQVLGWNLISVDEDGEVENLHDLPFVKRLS